jgi:hypothetical protein
MPRGKPGSHISCSRECRKMWRDEHSHSQMNSHFGTWSPNGLPNHQWAIVGVKNHWIEEFLISLNFFGMYMFKVGSHDPFGHIKHKLWPKERLGVKLAIWLLTTKSQGSPRFPYVQVAYNMFLENSQQGLQLCLRLHLNRRSAQKVMGPQSCGSPNFGNFETPTWESQDKMPFGC